MNRQDLVNVLSDSLVWQVVSEYVEQINQVPIMLKDIRYYDISNLPEVTMCEVFVCDSFDVLAFEVENGKIIMDFEMPMVYSVWSHDEQQLRITTIVRGKCAILDLDNYDWERFDFSKMNRLELLRHQDLVEIIELGYHETECDDVSFL
jgi:hypothetical protein